MIITDSIRPPKVSVIVTVYNTDMYLRQCLGSLLSQTLEDIEVICVNDGSTDKSLSVIEEYMKKDDRIKLINQEHLGIAASRNKGRYLCRGEYIGFLNSDDYVKPDTYQKLYENAKEYDSDITICSITTLNPLNMEFLDEDKTDLFSEEFDERAFRPDETYDFMFKICPASWNKIYKRELLEKKHVIFNEKMNFEEYLFFIEGYLSSSSISIVRTPLVVHRIDNYTKDSGKLDLFNIMKLQKEFLIRKKLYKELKYQFEKAKKNTLVHWYKTIKNPWIKIRYRIKLFFEYPFKTL